MKIKRIAALIMTLTTAFSVAGQTDRSPTITNWGTMSCGARLSIALSNNIIPQGTNIVLTCLIKNDSTNLVSAPMWAPMGFYAILTNNFGTLHELIPNPEKFLGGSSIASSIMPGQTNSYKVLLNFKQDIKPGNYELVVSRTILVEHKSYKLVSNALKINV